MSFENFAAAESFFLWSAFFIALIMGAVVNKTNFCTMGAVSDWVNMGDKSRLRAWLLAIAVAMIGVITLESAGMLSADGAFPPYRGGQLAWIENLLGGLLFGIGMTLASGCGNKTLIRIGGGNIKSIFVLLVIGVIAYYMVNPFPNSDQTLYSTLFYSWTNPMAIDMGAGQDLGTVVAGSESAMSARLIIGAVIAAGLLFFIFKSGEFRGSFDNILGGLVVGLAVLAAWYVTSNVIVDMEGDMYDLPGVYSEWDMMMDSDEGKPAAGAPLSPQSYTFINPMGQSAGYVASGFNRSLLTFGIMGLFGVIAGSLLWSIISRSFNIEWFASVKDFVTHLVGAILMGFGGVLAMGCTIGQGITGVSTLAIGSFIALIAIIFGSAMTMKVQLYKMVYEDEASIFSAIITGLADMKLLPNSMRKHDAI
ncbi:MAG: YeeE/YedE family protein [Gammaproteobacteria bacterium]|nr:YeeE/YedE family protein [Gammaproteobacteria bacterium]